MKKTIVLTIGFLLFFISNVFAGARMSDVDDSSGSGLFWWLIIIWGAWASMKEKD